MIFKKPQSAVSTSGTKWDLPDPIEVVDVRVDQETSIKLRRHGNTSGPRLVLSHGNGLAIDLYYPFWSLLMEDFDLAIYDVRNHGWNDVGRIEDHTIPTLVRDHDVVMNAIDEHFEPKPKVGVFHSVSGLTTLLSPTKGSPFAARVLFDPPLCKPGRSYADFEAAAVDTSKLIRQRAHIFSTREQLSDILPFTPSFQRVMAGVADLFAMTTLRERDGGRGF